MSKSFDEWWTEQGYSNPVERSYAEESWEEAQQECVKHCLELLEEYEWPELARTAIKKEFK